MQKVRHILLILGVLDLISFARTSAVVLTILSNNSFILWGELQNPVTTLWLPLLNIILAALLLASGMFLIWGKKAGIIIYYFEFPLRLLFLVLTFGIMLSLFGFQSGSVSYRVALTIIAAMEVLRLVFSIWVHRKYFKPYLNNSHLRTSNNM